MYHYVIMPVLRDPIPNQAQPITLKNHLIKAVHQNIFKQVVFIWDLLILSYYFLLLTYRMLIFIVTRMGSGEDVQSRRPIRYIL